MKEKMTDAERRNIGEIAVKKNKTVELIVRIGCLLLAFVIWYCVVSLDNTESELTIKSVPVQIAGENELSVLSGAGSLVDITVTGKRSLVTKLKDEDIRAYVDISDINSAGSYKLEIHTEVPDGISVSGKSIQNVSVYLDNTGSKSVPVQVKLTNYMLEEGYQLRENEASSSVSQVIVTGPEGALDNVAYARITLNLGKITKTITYNGELVLVDAAGNEIKSNYIRMQNSQTTVTVPVYKYRDVPVDILYKYGYLDDTNSVVNVEPQTVRVIGEADDVDLVHISYTIDEKMLEGNTMYSFDINLPDGIENVDGVDEVQVVIRHVGTSLTNLTLFDIEAKNPNQLNYTVLQPAIKVKLRGPSSLVSAITTEDIKATIDLSGAKENSGTVTVPVTLSFAEEYEGYVYEIGEYSVTVRIG